MWDDGFAKVLIQRQVPDLWAGGIRSHKVAGSCSPTRQMPSIMHENHNGTAFIANGRWSMIDDCPHWYIGILVHCTVPGLKLRHLKIFGHATLWSSSARTPASSNLGLSRFRFTTIAYRQIISYIFFWLAVYKSRWTLTHSSLRRWRLHLQIHMLPTCSQTLTFRIHQFFRMSAEFVLGAQPWIVILISIPRGYLSNDQYLRIFKL